MFHKVIVFRLHETTFVKIMDSNFLKELFVSFPATKIKA